MGMAQIASLIKVNDVFLDLTGSKEVTISYRVFRDSGKIRKLRAGEDITVTRLNSAMSWFFENWPSGKPRPVELLRWAAEAEYQPKGVSA
jgi:hypothetical protein